MTWGPQGTKMIDNHKSKREEADFKVKLHRTIMLNGLSEKLNT